MSENSEPYELVNGSSELESSAAAADTASAADPDDQLPDPKDTDVQPFDAERVGSVHIEASNSMQEERVLYAFNDADSRTPQSNQNMGSDSKLRDSEVDRTITMREPLNELKNGDGNGNDERKADTPRSQQNLEQQIEQNIAVVELMNSVTAIDEERRSRQRHLTNAAQRYATTVERNPEDYDALYRWALLLQESADNVSSESSSQSKDALLEEACKKYKEATRLCPTLGEAYYDWAVAISARARIRGRTNEAEEFWKQSTKYYERAVQLNWNNGQALNNWGLALQELSAIVPAREKQTIVRTAISKFRAAIQLQFDFHGAIYNVGTVLYGLADDILRTGGHDKVSRDELYKQSALYIAVAHALKPNYSLYYSALKLTRSMLPLPYLKVGYLTAPPVGNPVAPHSDWKRSQFLLNHEGLQQYNRVERRRLSPNLSLKSGDSPVSKPIIRVDVPDIVSVSACADLTLPPGAGLCIDTIHGPVFLIADTWESLGGWLDAVRLVYTIFAKGKRDVLAGILIA